MANFYLLRDFLLLCFVVLVFGEEKRVVRETKFNPVSHTFQPIHRQPIQQRTPIRRQTVRLAPVRNPVETKIIRGESAPAFRKTVEPEKPVRIVEPEVPVRRVEPERIVLPVPKPAVQREYGSPEIRDHELEIERRPDRRTTARHDPVNRDREYGQNRENGRSRDREIGQTRQIGQNRDREIGLEAALFSEPTTPGTQPELIVTTVSPTHPAYTTIDAAIRREPPSLPGEEEDEEEEEDPLPEEELDPTEVENGVNDRRRDQSPIKTAIDYTKYKPRKRNLREKRLLRLLGDDYDPDWMSFERPKELRSVQPVGIAYKTDANLLTALNNLNFTFQSPNGLSFQPPPQLLNVFKDWLIRTAGCPVTFTWHDIGDYYWPRWVKRGECMNESPCSWPPGQRCVPVRSHTVFILRWHCRRTLPRYLRRGRRFFVRGSPSRRDRSGEGRSGSDARSGGEGRGGGEERRNGRKRNRNQSRRRASRRDLPSSNLQAESRPASSLLTTRIKCRWLKIPYPVIANCFCTCP